MINLIGTYNCKLDTKNRVMVPASLKSQLHLFMNKGFVIKRSVFNTCLELYPMSEWIVMVDQVNKLNRFVKKNNDFIRSYTAGLRTLDIDSTGRILIPKDLTLFSGITKNIVLTASLNMIEIWDQDQYESIVKETLTNFSELAEEVMGQNDRIEDVS